MYKNLRVCFPKWVIISYSICAIGTLFFFIGYIIKIINENSFIAQSLKFLLFLGVVVVSFWLLFKIVFYSVTATDKGLETSNLFGSNKSVNWEEIVAVRKPIFGIPADFTYVFTINKKKLLLVKSMNNYKELVQLIKEKSPNLQKCEF